MPAPPIDGDHGTWDWTTDPSAPQPDGSKGSDGINIKYTPKASANCTNIRLFQTVKSKAYNAAGELVGSSIAEIFDEAGGDDFGHLGANHVFVTEDGRAVEVFVDHARCEGDPYYNGDDAPQDGPSKGDSTTAPPTDTSLDDYPGNFFDGTVKPGIVRIEAIFETCAICADDGRILGCIKWKTVVTPTDAGTITVLSNDEGDASDEAKRALKQFASRHTVWASSPDGKPHWFCPEDGKVKHGFSEGAYRRIVFNQVVKTTPSEPPRPMEHGFRRIDLRRDHAGGGRSASFGEVREVALANLDGCGVKFTWTGPQVKSVAGLVLSARHRVSGSDIEPFVENQDKFRNDFGHLSVARVTSHTMRALLRHIGDQQSDGAPDEVEGPIMLSLIANLGSEEAVGASKNMGKRDLGEVLLKLATQEALDDTELDAVSYLRLNMCHESPIRRLGSNGVKSSRESWLWIVILILLIGIVALSVANW